MLKPLPPAAMIRSMRLMRSGVFFARAPLLALPLLLVLPAAPPAQTVVQLPDSLHAAGDTVVWVKRVPSYCEGPAWGAASGHVYFTQQGGSAAPNWPIWRVKPSEDTGVVWVNTHQSNGLEFDGQGRLVAAQNGRLSRYLPNGTLDSTLVVSGANGVSFNQANDLSIGSNGAIYFTALGSAVYYLSPAGQLSVATTNIAAANGIEWVEEDSAVYVNAAVNGGSVYRFAADPNGANGSLGARTAFINPIDRPDGGALDSHGNRYVASYQRGEVRVYNAAGDSIGRIAMATPPGSYNAIGGVTGNASNCAFGGADLKTLYITGDGGLYSIRLKVPGRPPAQAPPVAIRSFGISGGKKNGDRALRGPHEAVEGVNAVDALGRMAPEDRTLPVVKVFPGME